MKKAVICLLLALSLCGAATGCGKKEEPAKKTEAKANTKKKETKEAYLVIGNESAEAFKVLLKNSTGQDITALTVKTSDKTEYPASMMKSGETLKNGKTAELYYTPEKAAADTAAQAANTDKLVNITYNVQVTLADGNVVELSSFGFEDIKEEAELCYEEGVGYIKYASKASGDPVTTKEQELGAKAQRDAAAQAAAAAQQVAQDAAAQQAAQDAAVQQAPEPTYTEPVYTEPEPVYTEPSYTEPSYTEPPAEQAPEQGSESCLGGNVAIN